MSGLVELLPAQKQASRGSQSIVDSLKRVLEECKQTRPTNICVMSIVRAYNIQHRRVYDFFNLLSALGICRSISKGRLAWTSVDEAQETLKCTYAAMEIASFDTPMQTLFSIGPSPSLGAIATRLLCLYLYLGEDKLVLRRVSFLLHDPRCDKKSLERRLYLVLNFLEILGMVSHTLKTSEYAFIMDRSQIVSYAMEKKQEYACTRFPCALEGVMAKLGDSYQIACYHQRRIEFEELVAKAEAGSRPR